MKSTVGFCEFQDAFTNCGRGESFTYDGFKALYDYLTQLEDEWGIAIELDAIAFDCEYTEYDSASEAASNYFEFEGMTYWEDGEELESEEKVEQKARDFLEERTQLIVFSTWIIIANF